MNGSYVNNSKNLSEFSQEVQKLCQKSLEARKSAYAPYSSFLVGAALLSQNGNYKLFFIKKKEYRITEIFFEIPTLLLKYLKTRRIDLVENKTQKFKFQVN